MAEPTQNDSNNEPQLNDNGHLNPLETLELNQERHQVRLDNIYYLLRLQEAARQQDFKKLHDMQQEQHRQMEVTKRSQHLLQLQIIRIQEIVFKLKQEKEEQEQETDHLATVSSSSSSTSTSSAVPAAAPATTATTSAPAPVPPPPQDQSASQTEQTTTTRPPNPIFPVCLSDIVDEPRASNAFKELEYEADNVIWRIIASYRAIRGGDNPVNGVLWADLPDGLKKSAIGEMEHIVDTWNAEWILKRQNNPEKWTQELPQGVESDDSFMDDFRENETTTSTAPARDTSPPERHLLTMTPNTSDIHAVPLERPASPDNNHSPRTTTTTTTTTTFRLTRRGTFVENVPDPEDASLAIVIPLELSPAATVDDANAIVLSRNEGNNDNAVPPTSSTGSLPDTTANTTPPGEGPSTSSTIMPTVASTSAENSGIKRSLDEDDDDEDDGHDDKRIHTEDQT